MSNSAVSLSRRVGAGHPFEFDIKRTFSAIKVRPQRIDNCVERRDLPRLGRLTVDILERHLQPKGEGVGPLDPFFQKFASRFAISHLPLFD